VLEFSSASQSKFDGDNSVGWSFTTNQAITVYALDVFDPSLLGTSVRLYNSSGTTLASASLSYADPTEGSPFPFYYSPITPVTLAAGQTYYVAQDSNGADPALLNIFAGGLTTDPAITYGAGVLGHGLGQNPTSDRGWRGV
jgi:hypothetical protein